jgi:hypothetical protein
MVAGQYLIAWLQNQRARHDVNAVGSIVHEDKIVGQALVIYLSWNKHAPIYRFYEKIRWDRMAQMIH